MRPSDIPRLERLEKKASFYNALFASPDFQKFKEEVIDARINSFFEVAKTADLTTEDGQRKALQALTRYQDLKFIFEDIFEIYALGGKQAGQELEKIRKENE